MNYEGVCVCQGVWGRKYPYRLAFYNPIIEILGSRGSRKPSPDSPYNGLSGDPDEWTPMDVHGRACYASLDWIEKHLDLSAYDRFITFCKIDDEDEKGDGNE